MSKTISARIDETLHNKLKDSCNDEGITVNDKLNKLLQENLNNSNKIEGQKTEIQGKKIESEQSKDEKKEREILEALLHAVEQKKSTDFGNKLKSINRELDSLRETLQTRKKVESIQPHNNKKKHGFSCWSNKKSF